MVYGIIYIPVTSPYTSMKLQKLIKTQSLYLRSVYYFRLDNSWLGIRRSSPNDRWKWVTTGRETTFNNSGLNVQNCAAVTHVASTGEWSDRDCNSNSYCSSMCKLQPNISTYTAVPIHAKALLPRFVFTQINALGNWKVNTSWKTLGFYAPSSLG